jgi:hypothetical protein
MTKLEQINQLRKAATAITGIPEIEDKEYRRVYYYRQNKRLIEIRSKPYRSSRRML